VHRQFAGIEQGAREIEALFTGESLWQERSRRCLEHFAHTHSGAETLERYGRLFDELCA
jgi:hypothetical protein